MNIPRYWECPYFKGEGKCSFSCHDEPLCYTMDPGDGWASERQQFEMCTAIAPDLAELYNRQWATDSDEEISVDEVVESLLGGEEWSIATMELVVLKIFQDRLKIIAQDTVIKGLRAELDQLKEQKDKGWVTEDTEWAIFRYTRGGHVSVLTLDVTHPDNADVDQEEWIRTYPVMTNWPDTVKAVIHKRERGATRWQPVETIIEENSTNE